MIARTCGCVEVFTNMAPGAVTKPPATAQFVVDAPESIFPKWKIGSDAIGKRTTERWIEAFVAAFWRVLEHSRADSKDRVVVFHKLCKRSGKGRRCFAGGINTLRASRTARRRPRSLLAGCRRVRDGFLDGNLV